LSAALAPIMHHFEYSLPSRYMMSSSVLYFKQMADTTIATTLCYSLLSLCKKKCWMNSNENMELFLKKTPSETSMSVIQSIIDQVAQVFVFISPEVWCKDLYYLVCYIPPQLWSEIYTSKYCRESAFNKTYTTLVYTNQGNFSDFGKLVAIQNIEWFISWLSDTTFSRDW